MKSPARKKPVVWVLHSKRAGENAQLAALASALGWQTEFKPLAMQKFRAPVDLMRLNSLHGLQVRSKTMIQPPWPDLVLSAGAASEPVSRWIRKASKGNSKTVHIGRNWAHRRHFDLIISTPQYRLKPGNNVLLNHLTLHNINADTLAHAYDQWSGSANRQPQPLIAVMVGGQSGPYTFGSKAAKRLASHLNQLSSDRGARLLVSTSARTPAATARALQGRLRNIEQFHHWSAKSSHNPYLAFLAAANEIVVTGDSIAMISEAVASGKPVHIFDPGVGAQSMRGSHAVKPEPGGNDFSMSALLYRWLMAVGPTRLSRNIRLVHNWLIANEHAVWLQPPYRGNSRPAPDEIGATVKRIRQLIGHE